MSKLDSEQTKQRQTYNDLTVKAAGKNEIKPDIAVGRAEICGTYMLS